MNLTLGLSVQDWDMLRRCNVWVGWTSGSGQAGRVISQVGFPCIAKIGKSQGHNSKIEGYTLNLRDEMEKLTA